ncbi:hypothetical protein KC19_VG230000 [Ceratodon purpureus]|uniref:Uncharacterized protein n=1 Tax=Ceratodon purpureus TaxID=3225 RepID=A0A8T0HTF0_CERPU|nr:hypothetical protein KC19_VG230000 [Ceratodon purpureus]
MICAYDACPRFYSSYRCEYGPKDFSHIVKPILEELLPKPKRKFRPPDCVPEGNSLAPDQKEPKIHRGGNRLEDLS